MELFPYTPRKNQKSIIQDIYNNIFAGKHFVFESGTGSGKTICALSAALSYALENDKKIIYTTRTNAQQRQVITELREIRKKTEDTRLFGVGIQGRSNMCLLVRSDPQLGIGTSEELAKFCSSQKKKTVSKKKEKGCRFFHSIVHNKQKIKELIKWTKKHLPTAEEFVSYCEQQEICPYEVNKLMVNAALLVVVPYIYVFDKTLRNMLLDWLSISDDEIILIVDEAHNLPDYIRDLFSAQLSTWMLTNCLTEAKKFGDPSVGSGTISVSKFCTTLCDIISSLRDVYIYGILETGLRKHMSEKNDAFIPSHELESEILTRLNIANKSLLDIANDLIAYGEKIQEYREKEGKLPRSFLHKLGVFLEFWIAIEMDQYIKLVVDSPDGKNPRIEAYCLGPSVGTAILRDVHSSIHMSGTLEPLEEYRDSIGLPPETGLVFYPSPFSLKNRKILFTSDVTTRYEDIMKDETIVSRMAHHISSICNSFPKNTIIFFPSYNILSMFQKNGHFDDINRNLYIEEQTMTQTTLMDLVTTFKSCSEQEGATLCSVMGGRISEGMDFPAEQLEIAVIVGIPYPKPTARQRGLQRYNDLKFGKGWDYSVNAPAARKILQAIGRLIRNETDRGVAIILDKRAPRFKKYIRDLTESQDLVKDIDQFINQ